MMVTDHGGKDVKNNFFSLCVLCVCLLLARSTIASWSVANECGSFRLFYLHKSLVGSACCHAA